MEAVKKRIAYLTLLLKRDISFTPIFFLMLPAFLRPRTALKVRLYDHPFCVPRGDLAGFGAMLQQIIVADQYHTNLLKDTDSVVDAGANMGIFSVFVAHNHPRCKVYAFEPTPATVDVLKENTKYYPNVKVFGCGLGEKSRAASLVIVEDGTGNYIGEGGIPVEIKAIDDLNIPMNFLKMDTEGYEANILKGAAETIKKYKPIVAMSAYHRPNDKTELPALLNSIAPYDCELRHDCEYDLICKPK
jgi:FkbM family methyltransferase